MAKPTNNQTGYNPRFLAWCEATGRAPREPFKAYQFMSWVQKHGQAFRDANGMERHRRLTDEQQDEFTEYLWAQARKAVTQ
jgi:hypothetical protein